MSFKNIPKIVSIVHQNEIETICKGLPKEGNLKYFVCYVIFNNGQAFVLSNMFHMLLSYYTEQYYKQDFSFRKEITSDVNYYLCDTVKGVTFAFRTGAGKVWGNYPFYESMFLGGVNSLKGFSRERFAGDAVVLGETEIRFDVARVNILVPGMFGISFFGGTGRVFLTGEDSKRWHSSFGSSLWISYLERSFNIGFTAAKSDEGYKFFIGSAFFL